MATRGRAGTVRGGGIKNELVIVVGDGVVIATVVPLTLAADSVLLTNGWVGRAGSALPA